MTPPKTSVANVTVRSTRLPMLLGRWYRVLRAVTSVSPAWWKNTSAPICSAAFQKGRNSGSSSVRPLMWSLISTPFSPSVTMQRSSSATEALTSCMGRVPSPAKRCGRARTMSAISSLISCAVRRATSAGR
jgi:hypothetical protein